MITLTEMREAVKRAVEERGKDFVYPDEWKRGTTCMYRNADGTPSCIVGLAVSYLFPNVKLPENTTAAEALRKIAVDEARAYAAAAQGVQDSGESWGTAYAEAERYARSLES